MSVCPSGCLSVCRRSACLSLRLSVHHSCFHLLGSQLPPEDRAEDTMKNEVCRSIFTCYERGCAREVQKMPMKFMELSGEEDADLSRKDEEEQEQEEAKKAEAAPGDAVVVKKGMCKFFEEGRRNRCDRGTYCTWAHSREEIGQKVQDPQNLKVVLCKYYAEGHCKKTSEECEFAHGRQELGLKKPEVPANQKKGGKE